MIAPQSRLLLWTGVMLAPMAVLATIPGTAVLVGPLMLALMMVAGWDAILGMSRLDGIKIALPAVARFSKDRESALDLEITNEKQRALRLRLGLALPREIQSAEEDLCTTLPAGHPRSRLAWRCTPRKRGNFLLEDCYLETSSPWGFWAVRVKQPMRAEIRVYPNLLAERKRVASFFMNRGNFGAHARRQVGKGRDFEKLREYIPGDSYDEIHWKATAKRGRPVTKIFQIERTQEVYVIIDASRLSARKTIASPVPAAVVPTESPEPVPVSRQSTLERFITAALVLGLAAEQQGDLIGLLTFSNGVQKFVRAKNGKSHYAQCRDALYALQPESVTPDFDDVFGFIRLRLRRRALLIFLTDLDDPLLAESFARNVDLICRQHLILVNMMKPPGVRPLFTGPSVSTVGDLYGALSGQMRWHKLRELEKILQRRGVSFALLDDEKLTAQLLAQYLSVKQRQLL